MRMSNLLFDEYPLLISPTLATQIGLTESVVLQQLHYWLNKSEHVHEGRKWVYNTYKDWEKQLPFWSDTTIKRAILKLEKMGIIISGNFNKLPIDKTKWYSIDHETLKRVTRPSGQIDLSSGSDWPIEQVKLTRPLPETTSKTSTKTSANKPDGYTEDFETFWGFYPRTRNMSKKATFGKWQSRLKDGATPDMLIIAAQNYQADCRKERREERFMMNPETFLGPNERYLPFTTMDAEPEPIDHNLQLLRDLAHEGPGDLFDI